MHEIECIFLGSCTMCFLKFQISCGLSVKFSFNDIHDFLSFPQPFMDKLFSFHLPHEEDSSPDQILDL